MTDRIRTLTVTLDSDMRDDDVEVVANAIRMIKRVDTVELGPVVDHSQLVASSDFKNETGQILNDVVFAACRMGMGSEPENDFMSKVKTASAELRRKRGY